MATDLVPGIFVDRENVSFSGLVRLSEVDGETVRFYPEGGGFEYRTDPGKFVARFRAVGDDELASLRARYREVGVIGDWFPDDVEPLKGYSNGAVWNGWAMPNFERETVEAAIQSGVILGPIFYDEPSDSYVVLMTQGDELAPYDKDAVLAAIKSDTWEIDMASTDGRTVAVGLECYKGREIQTDRGSVKVYDIGAGSWCWMQAEDPVAAPSP